MNPRDELKELAKWLEDFANTPYRKPLEQKQLRKSSSALRELLAQEPVAMVNLHVVTKKDYQTAIRKAVDLLEHGYDLPPRTPLYAAPVPAVDLEAFKQEAMRLAEVYATRKYIEGGECGGDWKKTEAARDALAAHLDKLGGK